jgi:hypothetical protein
MNILDALDDPKVFGDYFRAGTWATWRVFLAALFGLPMTDDQLATYRQFTGRSTPPTTPSHEAWLVHRFDEIDHMGVGFIFAETTCSLTA